MVVEIFGIDDAERMREALAIRTRVFVDEQGVPSDEEIDEHDRSDPSAAHALVRPDIGATAIGAGRFYVSMPGTVQIGRMAVVPASRGTGVGRALLEALAGEARNRGFHRAHLHAQVHAREFYVKSGFFDDGEQLWDAGILHQPMSRELA